jgi:cysteine-rich repeat protein
MDRSWMLRRVALAGLFALLSGTGAAAARTVTVTATGPHLANGSDPCTVTVELAEDDGTPIEGAVVQLEIFPPTFSNQIAHDVLHLLAFPVGGGRYTASFTSWTPGPMVVIATTPDHEASGTGLTTFLDPSPAPLRAAPKRLESVFAADAKDDCAKFFDKLDEEFYPPLLQKKIDAATGDEKARLQQRMDDLIRIMLGTGTPPTGGPIPEDIRLEEKQARGMPLTEAEKKAFSDLINKKENKDAVTRLSADLRKIIEDAFGKPVDPDKFQACTELFNNFKLVKDFDKAIERIEKARMGMLPDGEKVVERGPDASIAHIRWAKFARIAIQLGVDADFWRTLLPTLAKGSAITADVLMRPPRMLKEEEVKKHRDMFDPLRPKPDDDEAKKKEKYDKIEMKLIELIKKINVDKKTIAMFPGPSEGGLLTVAINASACPLESRTVEPGESGPFNLYRVGDALMAYGVTEDGRSYVAAGTVVGSEARLVLAGHGFSPVPDGSMMALQGTVSGDFISGTLQGIAFGEVQNGAAPCTWEGTFSAELVETIAVTCGNTLIEPGEACDDGNLADGDGCSSTCQIEDQAEPTCSVTRRMAGPPAQVEVTFQDSGSGLAGLLVVRSKNAETPIPPFAVGTVGPVVVTATKIDPSRPARVEIHARDVAGNAAVCDPVLTLMVRASGRPVRQTHTGVAASDDTITVLDASPRIALEAVVNGVRFKLRGPGETVDISSALRAGDDNVVIVRAKGRPGSWANLLLWEGEEE